MLSSKQAYIREFDVVPILPEALSPLMEIAHNLWWSWQADAVALFVKIDHGLWTESGHNPIKMLGRCPQGRLDELAGNEAYVQEVRRVHARMHQAMLTESWFYKQGEQALGCCVAYFSAEYGIHESLPIYSGGLGLLSGEHLKSASDLGIPLVGVGLLYRHGYFQQYLSADGWQQEFYPDIDFSNSAVRPVRAEDGQALKIEVDMPDRKVHLAVWQALIGRVRLLLLDTNIPDNRAEDRGITAQLYGGDMEMRIRQEIVLGIGGMRALAAVGLKPTVLHMNEGHAAFMALEHIRCIIAEHNCAFDEARHAAAAMQLFTTHTPIAAGIDRFPPDMVRRYFEKYIKGLKLDMEGLLALGRENVFNKDEWFSMAVLALRTSDAANGVSRLHGHVSRDMWVGMWPAVPNAEVPIGHVTNGVHAESWVSPQLAELFDRQLTLQWRSSPQEPEVWKPVHELADEQLWQAHELRREKLVQWVRKVHAEQIRHRGADSDTIRQAEKLLDPGVLTIGFARRFATYKRAYMLFSDTKRLMSLLCDAKRPVQIVVAGKAHPADSQGKELIRKIVHFAEQSGAADRVVFLENYNIAVARYVVQGCDLWLNNPRRGLEASGTSGMKAAMNGVLNCSILDGWWDEAWEHDAGWAIGRGETFTNHEYQDQMEAQSLYELLEKQVVPLFYDRDAQGVPRRWVARMKNCIARYTPAYNTHRMLVDYWRQYYRPSHERGRRLVSDGLAVSRELAAYVRFLRTHWHKVRVNNVEASLDKPMGVRTDVGVNVEVRLAEIEPNMVKVQCYFGPLDADGHIANGQTLDLEHAKEQGRGVHAYVGKLTPTQSGRHGMSVRIIPGHPALANPYMPGLIAWDKRPEPKPEPVKDQPQEAVAAS